MYAEDEAETQAPVSVLDRVIAAGRVCSTASLVNAGASRHAIDRAVARGEISRVRRGWVNAPGADEYLVAAARAGVVVTCITQAKRGGLWVLDEAVPHVGAPPHAGRVATLKEAIVHWAQPVVPRHPDQLVDGMENVLAIVATCQPHDVALAIWESAFRQNLASPDLLRRLDLGPAARALCAEADPFADSGLESFVMPRLRWMNLPLRRQIWIAGSPVDLLIGERLVLQIDGGHHVGPQRERDIAHDAQLALLGYTVIRVGYASVVYDWPAVQERIMRAVAQGLHRAPTSGAAARF
jgi:very-short-patch-repair endonuclease